MNCHYSIPFFLVDEHTYFVGVLKKCEQLYKNMVLCIAWY